MKETVKKHDLNWLWIPGHPYRILKVGGPESRKTN